MPRHAPRRTRYGGLEVSEAKRLKALEDESAKLKRLMAEAILDNAVGIPTMSAGHSELKSATCSDSSRPAVPIDVGRGGGSPAGRW